MRNYFREIQELDSNLSREENCQRLREAWHKWNKRIGAQAQNTQNLIKEALEIFEDEEKYKAYRAQLVEQELKPIIEVALADDDILTPEEESRIIDHAQQQGLTEAEVKRYINSLGITIREKPVPSDDQKAVGAEQARKPDSHLMMKRVDTLLKTSEVVTVGLGGAATLILLQVPLESVDSLSTPSSWTTKGIFLLMPSLALGASNLVRGNRFLWMSLGLAATIAIAFLAETMGKLAIINPLVLFFFISTTLLFFTALTNKLLKNHLAKCLSSTSGWVGQLITMSKPLAPAGIILLFLLGAYGLSLSGVNLGFQAQQLLAIIKEEIRLGVMAVNDAIKYLEQYITVAIVPALQELMGKVHADQLWLIASWIFYLSFTVMAVFEVTGVRTGMLRSVINRIFTFSLIIKVVEFVIGWITLTNPMPVLVSIIGTPPEDMQSFIAQHHVFLAVIAVIVYWHFFTRFKVLMVLLTILFGLPVLAGQVYVPADLSAESLSKFLSSLVAYWRELIIAIWHALQSNIESP